MHCQAMHRKQRKVGQASLGRGETHGWFASFGKLRIRFERRLDIHDALLKLAAAIICARFVDRWCCRSKHLPNDVLMFE